MTEVPTTRFVKNPDLSDGNATAILDCLKTVLKENHVPPPVPAVTGRKKACGDNYLSYPSLKTLWFSYCSIVVKDK